MPIVRAEVSSMQERPRSLLVLQNGLFGHSENWNVILEAMEVRHSKALDERSTVVLVGKSNERFGTFDGMDECGVRLATEVQEFIAQHSTLEDISFIGHSMGGKLPSLPEAGACIL